MRDISKHSAEHRSESGSAHTKKRSLFAVLTEKTRHLFAPKSPILSDRKLIIEPTEGLKSSDAKDVEHKLKQFEKTVANAERLDAEIVRLQQASRTTFKSFRKLHVYLSVRSRLYNHLHSVTYANQLHVGAIVAFFVTFGITVSVLYNPSVRVKDGPLFVNYIKASTGADDAIYNGDNGNILVGFSQKEVKTVGINVVADEKLVKNSDGYRLGLHLLADGLDIPQEKQLGSEAVSWDWNPKQSYSVLPRAQAQTDTTSLPSSTVAHVPEIESPNPETVIFKVSDDIIARYQLTEWKIKETITVRKREAIQGTTLSFALNQRGLVFKKDTDGSWQAFREEDKDRMDKSTAVFRLFAPTIKDADEKSGTISLDIKDDRAIYTLDEGFLNSAAYPIVIDPTISPSGRTCTWNNGAATNVWATAGNWSCTSGSGPPAAGDAIVFDDTSNTASNAAAGTVIDDIYSFTMAATYTNTVTFAAAAIDSNDGTPDDYKWDLETVTVNGGNFALTGDATVNPAVIPDGCSASVKCGRGIEINANDITVGASGTIHANGKGFAGLAGPGTPSATYYSGGSYGGQGGTDNYVTNPVGATYGSITQPNSLGSGGGPNGGATGGGALKLTVSGTLTINGTVSAKGTDTSSFQGAGAGGSVWIATGTLAGSGTISVNGGLGSSSGLYGSAGGGGRMAITYTTDTFSGAKTAYGGTQGEEYGAAGTIFTKSGAETNGTLIVDNNNIKTGPVHLTSNKTSKLPTGSHTFDTMVLKREGSLTLTTGSTLNIQSTSFTGGDNTGKLAHSGTGTLTTNSTLTIAGWQLEENTSAIGSVTDLTIDTNGILSHTTNLATETNKLNISLTTLTINANGAVNVDGKGYYGTYGPGTPTTNYYNGGGYGGTGSGTSAGDGGPSYGDPKQPNNLGSGGGLYSYSNAGGAAKLTVSGTLTVNGTIRSVGGPNTSNGYSGGSSGGSIWLDAGTITGNGSIVANGGTVNDSSACGGGGRIAIYMTTDSYSGTKTAYGGAGCYSGSGSAGSIYTKLASQTNGTLTIDNNNLDPDSGRGWSALPAGSHTFDTIIVKRKGRLLVGNGATLDIRTVSFSGSDNTGIIAHSGTGVLTTNSSLTINGWQLEENTAAIGTVTDLTIASTGILSHSPNRTTETNKLNISLTNITIQSGGTISANAKGHAATAGAAGGGPGGAIGYCCAGGSYGGLGGAGAVSGEVGPTYGSSTNPTQLGSAGWGAGGGGAVLLTLSGTLDVQTGGTITTTGQAGQGAGSGGSVLIKTASFIGGGAISANGANATANGGGGGGRVAIYVTGSTDTYSGTKVANGGTGSGGPAGAAGTVVTQHFPVVTINSPTNGATNQSQNTAISFSATDVESDYYRARVEVSDDSFISSCVFTQTETTSSFTAGTCTGDYASFAGAFTGMNSQNSTAYTSGTTGTFTISNDLTQNQAYQIRVKAADPAGAAGNLAATPGLIFDGGDYVSLPSSSTLDITGDITLEAWVKTSSSGVQVVIGSYDGFGNTTTGYGLGVGIVTAGKIGHWDSVSNTWIESTSTVNDGAWHHIATSLSGTTLRIFKDGTLDRTATASAPESYTGTRAIGANNVNAAGFVGQIDEVRISNSARYTATFSASRVPFSSDSNTKGLWHLDENTGQTTADSSSSAYNGTLGANSSAASDDPAWTDGTTSTTTNLWAQVTVYGSTAYTVAPISKLIYTASHTDTTCADTSSAQTIIVGQVSSIYRVQICNVLDEAVKMTSNQTINLSTNSAYGTFSTDSSGSPTVTSITVATNATGATFYYKDTQVGTPTLTAAPQGQSWTNATQNQTIKSDTPIRIHLSITSSPTSTTAGASLTGTIRAYDQYGNVATDFAGDKSIRFAGAGNAPSAPEGGTIYPTATNKTGTATTFGSDTTITFTSGVSATSTIVLKLTETAGLTIVDYTSGSAGINNTTPENNTYSIQVTPGALNYFTASDYPQQSTGQFSTAGFPWNSTGLAGGNQAPYDVVTTAYDAYSNVKYDYTGAFWFSMDSGTSYVFPYDAVGNAYTHTWNNSHTSHPIRTSTSDTYDNGRHIFSAATFTVNTGGQNQNFFLNGAGSIQTTLKINIKPTSIGSLGIAFAPAMTTEVVDTNFNSNVVVTAYDVIGNVKTDYTGEVFFTSTDSTATLPYTSASKYTYETADLDTKTFSGSTFRFNAGGNHTVTASDTTSDPANPFTATTNVVVVPTHPVTNFTTTAGHESATLAWTNPTDAAVSKVNIYQSTTNGVLGTRISAQPAVTPGTVSQYTVPGLTNGTTYYFTVKAFFLDAGSNEIESVASSQVSVLPADIAPRNVSASQGSDGRITITYGLRYDATVSISYYNPDTLTWTAASSGAMSGDVGAGVTGSEAITSHTAYFTPSIDFPSKYFTSAQGFKVRIDVVSQGSNAAGVSNNLLLDTKPPYVNSGEAHIVVDATGTSLATVTLIAREDGATEQTIQYRLSNNEDMSGASEYTTLATKPTILTNWNLDNSDTVYVQFRDPYNNITKVSNSILTSPTAFGIKDASSLDENKYRLVLTWTDPVVANFARFVIERSTDGSTFEQIDTTTKDGYINVGLTQSAKYYYRVKTQDTFNNVSRPTPVLSSQPGAAPDITAKPTIEVQNWKQEYGVRATVTWNTDQKGTSFVAYSTQPLQTGSSTLTTTGETAQVVGQFDNSTEHKVLIQQLEPSTEYYLKALSQNEINITGASEVVKIITPARIPLTLSGVTFSGTETDSTTVGWETNKLSTTILEYGTSTSYGSQIEDKNLNTDHSIKLSNLTSGTTYNVRIKATDADNNTTTSDNYVVSIPAIPAISDVRVTDLLSTSATITWNTNVNTDSNVEFGLTSSYGSQQGKSDSTTVHSVTIIGLEAATTYTYRVRGTDGFNNVALSGNATFTTPSDTTAPVISNVKSEITTTGAGETVKIQAIISWETDESATSQVEYGLGLSGTYPNQTPETTSFNQSHVLILPDLKPNSSYQYRIVAKDAAGNSAKGEDLNLISPPKERSLLRLVIEALQEQFKWWGDVQNKWFKK